MSKGLEALERIERDMEYVTRLDFVEPIVRGEVQQELYKIYHREEKDLDIIEKELKALEIIKNEIIDKKRVNFYSSDKKDKIIIEIAYCVIEENKFDLLKEVLL